MKSNRRNFLQHATLAAGAAMTGLPHQLNAHDVAPTEWAPARGKQSFNMCGYAAPKLETVRIGFVGLGNRGPGAVGRISRIAGVEIKALCDKDPARASKAQGILEKAGLPKAKEYSGENGWKTLCESNEIDLVYICTPWSLHTPMAVYAMQPGKHAVSEVPAAKTGDVCWQLVET